MLLIITDGAIHDEEESIRTIVNASNLPLSILIIGVGNDDFTAMKVGVDIRYNEQVLDGDENRLHVGGLYASRDVVIALESHM